MNTTFLSKSHWYILFPLALLVSLSIRADAPIYTGTFSNTALSGYDTVAYFETGAAAKGSKQHSTEYMGARWLFSSADHLNKFKANPAFYAPQFGGYCAWAVAHNNTAKGDPLQWTLYKDKLYLNYDASIKALWRADKDAKIAAAEANWPAVLEH